MGVRVGTALGTVAAVLVATIVAGGGFIEFEWSNPSGQRRAGPDPDRNRVVRITVVSKPERTFDVDWTIGGTVELEDDIRLGKFLRQGTAKLGQVVRVVAEPKDERPPGDLYLHCAIYVNDALVRWVKRNDDRGCRASVVID